MRLIRVQQAVRELSKTPERAYSGARALGFEHQDALVIFQLAVCRDKDRHFVLTNTAGDDKIDRFMRALAHMVLAKDERGHEKAARLASNALLLVREMSHGPDRQLIEAWIENTFYLERYWKLDLAKFDENLAWLATNGQQDAVTMGIYSIEQHLENPFQDWSDLKRRFDALKELTQSGMFSSIEEYLPKMAELYRQIYGDEDEG